MSILPAILSTNSLPETLDLSATQIDCATALALANTLANNNTLAELILCDNENITIHGWSAFLRALCRP